MSNTTIKIILFLLSFFMLMIMIFYLKVYDKDLKIYFSKESGFYDTDFLLEIKGDGEIYYTLDGSIPTKQSVRYTKPIHIIDASNHPNTNSMNKEVSPFFDNADESGVKYESPKYLIDKCNIVRAVSYLRNGKKTQVITASYFIGFQNKPEYKDVGIISLVSAPKNLFDKKTGIYVLGDSFFVDKQFNFVRNANFNLRGKISEREAYIDIFDKDRNLILQKNVGIRIHGNYTREYLPKSLNVYFRNKYDKINNFYGNIIDEKYNPTALTLLSPSSDFTRMKDFLVMSLYNSKNIATMKFKPYLLFLNGEYWGFYYLTEKYNIDFISYHYKIEDKNNIIMLKAEDDEIRWKSNEMLRNIKNNDFSVEKKYDILCDMLNIDSFIEYIAILMYTGREDFFHWNCGIWKTIKKTDNKYQNGKWWFMLYDLDNICNEVVDNTDIHMILNLVRDRRFKEKFYDKLIEISKKEMSPSIVENFIKINKDFMRKYIVNDYKRFYGMNETDGNKLFEESIDAVVSFFRNRPRTVLKYFGEDF